MKLNTIDFVFFAIFVSIAEDYQKSKDQEHDSVYYLVRAYPFPKISDFWKIRPRHTTKYHDYDTAQQAGENMSDQTFQLSDEGFITFCVEEVVHLGCVSHFNFDNPAFAVWVVVDCLWSVGESLVEFDDFAAHWHEHL